MKKVKTVPQRKGNRARPPARRLAEAHQFGQNAAKHLTSSVAIQTASRFVPGLGMALLVHDTIETAKEVMVTSARIAKGAASSTPVLTVTRTLITAAKQKAEKLLTGKVAQSPRKVVRPARNRRVREHE